MKKKYVKLLEANIPEATYISHVSGSTFKIWLKQHLQPWSATWCASNRSKVKTQLWTAQRHKKLLWPKPKSTFSPGGAVLSLPIISPNVQKFAVRTRRQGLCTKTGSASLRRASNALKHGSFLDDKTGQCMKWDPAWMETCRSWWIRAKRIWFDRRVFTVWTSGSCTWLSLALWQWSWGVPSRRSPCWDLWSMPPHSSPWGKSSIVIGSPPAGPGYPGWAAPYVDPPLRTGGTELGGGTWRERDRKHCQKAAEWKLFWGLCCAWLALPQSFFARPRPPPLCDRHLGHPVGEAQLWALTLHVAAGVSYQERQQSSHFLL